MSRPRKLFADKQERKAFFTQPGMRKQPHQYAHVVGGSVYPNPSYYVQQPFQPAVMSNYGPPCQYTITPGPTPWMGSPSGFNYAQPVWQPVVYMPNYGPPIQSHFPTDAYVQPQPQLVVSSQFVAGMPQHYPIFQHDHSQFQDPSTFHHEQTTPSSESFNTDAMVCKTSSDNSPSTSPVTRSSTANSSTTPLSSGSADISKASELKRKASTETIDALKKAKLHPQPTLGIPNHHETSAQHPSKLKTSSVLGIPNHHKTSAQHPSKLEASSTMTTTKASSKTATNKDNTATNALSQSKGSSRKIATHKAEELLRQEHRAAMKHHMMNKDPDDPVEHLKLTLMEERRVQDKNRRTEAITEATSSLESSRTILSPSPSSNAGTPTLMKQETSMLADLAGIPMMSNSQATTRCQSPESKYRNLYLKASDDENRMSQTDDFEKVEDELLDSDQDFVVNEPRAMSEKRVSRILQGLASTLKVASETPKRRPKPSYAYEDPYFLNDSQAMREM